MPWKPCTKCGCLFKGAGSRCSQHKPVNRSRTRQTPGRGGGSAAAAFRKAIMARSHGRCEAIVNGARCNSTEGVQAHHIVPLRAGGTNNPTTNGMAACKHCHPKLEPPRGR